MLDHIGLSVVDFARSRTFYIAILAPLGYKLMAELHEVERAGFGAEGDVRPTFWIKSVGVPVIQFHPDFIATTPAIPLMRFHVAFSAPNAQAVQQFYIEALQAGGKSNGRPGVRAEYHEKYYSAYIGDPDGHNIEAVFNGNEVDSPLKKMQRKKENKDNDQSIQEDPLPYIE